MPTPTFTEILLLISLLPALALIIVIYRSDYIEKEPWSLLFKMFCLGCFSTLPAVLFETVGEALLAHEFSQNSFVFILIESFLVIAVAEEGFKYLMLRTVRNNPNFNYTFDGIMYAVMVGLGFAALENLMYVFMSEGSLETALMRAVTAVPMHCAFAIFMGAFFGMSKKHAFHGNVAKSISCEWLAFLVPVSIHGFYDMALMSGDIFLALFVWVFVGTVFSCAGIQVRKSAFADAPVAPPFNSPPF